MKLIIDIPEIAYEAYKEWNKNMVATVEQSLIANGTPYEERPQGEWIEHTSEEMSKLGFVKCSKCKAGFHRYERGIRHSDLPWIDGQPYELHLIDNFCPNCGAYMRGISDGTN